jgi:hypothetical protein
MTFTVCPDEIVVDTNENGFTLLDVLSICDTGQSSKKFDEESTGEKGFGFKAVFGVANSVHIQSGLWSFRFKHQRHQNGMGMITPIWESPETSLEGGTRFRLRGLMSEEDSSETLKKIWIRLDTQHASLLFALRKIRKISIEFRDVESRNHKTRLKKSVTMAGEITTITSSVADCVNHHYYRTFKKNIKDMPKTIDRPRNVTTIKIGFPVTASVEGSPKTEIAGQFIFAYLPVMQLAQLPFVIHADFLLPEVDKVSQTTCGIEG